MISWRSVKEFLFMLGLYKRCPVCGNTELIPFGSGITKWRCDLCGWGYYWLK